MAGRCAGWWYGWSGAAGFAPQAYWVHDVYQPCWHEGLGLRHQGPRTRRHWEVFHRERDVIQVPGRYATEEQACADLLDQMRPAGHLDPAWPG